MTPIDPYDFDDPDHIARRDELARRFDNALARDPHAAEPPWADPAAVRMAATTARVTAIETFVGRAVVDTPWSAWPAAIRAQVAYNLAGLHVGGVQVCHLVDDPAHGDKQLALAVSTDRLNFIGCLGDLEGTWPPTTCACCGDLADDAVLLVHGRIAVSAGLCAPHAADVLTTEYTHRVAAEDTLRGTQDR